MAAIGTPAVIAVVYAGYPYDLTGRINKLLGSTWLAAVGADYGVGLGSVAGSVLLDGGPNGGPLAVTDQEIQDLLATLIFDGGASLATPNTIYVVAYPESTTITSPDGTSCADYRAYHSAFAIPSGVNVPYCVLPTCSPLQGMSVKDQLDIDMAHELIEAATDPTPPQGYSILGGANEGDPWVFAGGGEVADLCSYTDSSYDTNGLFLPAVWSNTAVELGVGSPCIPQLNNAAYYSVTVDPATTVVLTPSATAQTITFTVTGWSTAAIEDWFVSPGPGVGDIAPASVLLNGSAEPIKINNGVSATLTVVIPAGQAHGSYLGIRLYSYASSSNNLASFSMAAISIP